MIVLDTHAWLWWLHDPSQLSPLAQHRIAAEVKTGEARVSAVSVWEIAVKVELGKLSLHLDLELWFDAARKYPGIHIEPMQPVDAIASARLPGSFHKDPADRLIVAYALRLGAPIVTKDRKISNYAHVQTIWF
jgi:PIN domain nuclease of toxin-antitoxin system